MTHDRPQMVGRWAQRFAVDIAVAVSALAEREAEGGMLVTASELSAIIEPRILPELENAFWSGKDEASHHAELVEALTEARKHLVARPVLAPLLGRIDCLLAKAGGQ